MQLKVTRFDAQDIDLYESLSLMYKMTTKFPKISSHFYFYQDFVPYFEFCVHVEAYRGIYRIWSDFRGAELGYYEAISMLVTSFRCWRQIMSPTSKGWHQHPKNGHQHKLV